jgi:hypothetical protein
LFLKDPFAKNKGFFVFKGSSLGLNQRRALPGTVRQTG